MALTPTLMHFAPALSNLLLKLPLPVSLKSGLRTSEKNNVQGKKDHIIIIGYGLNGRNLARSAKAAHIPYVILELNAETVKKEKQKGEYIYFGDACHENVLHHANITDAKAMAVVINDSQATERIVKIARKLHPHLYIIVRTRYLREMQPMLHLGADAVIPDEFGSSVEIFTRVLHKYQIPSDEVQKIVSEMRIEGYDMLRMLYRESTSLQDLQITLSDVLIETFRVFEGSFICGKTLSESALRKDHGCTAMLIKRGEATLTQIDGQTTLLPNDILVLVGTHDHLKKILPLFKTQPQLQNSAV